MRRAGLIAFGALLWAGCSSFGLPSFTTCHSDNDCGDNQVCFPEGCGDPGRGLVVEIRGNAQSGQLAEDVAIADGGFSPSINIELSPPTLMLGEFQRNNTPAADPQDRSLYTETVTVKATGESDLIPGLVRSYQATFTRPERGTYSLPMGAGHFTITAQPDDPSIPPLFTTVGVQSGTSTMVSFAFPSADGTLTFAGRLLKRTDVGPPATEIAVTQAAMDVQAFDPTTHRPLSQPAHVSSGTAGSTGDFVLSISPDAQYLDSFQVVASPHDQGTLVPSKTFTITRPFPSTINLELGDFGDPLPQLQGELNTTGGQPVAGASVFLEGVVTGGGVFRSRVVTTDANGTFRVDVLPSATDGAYLLTALPPPASSAGVLTTQLKAIAKYGQLAALSPSTVTCPDKITVTGSLIKPDGTAAAQVTIIAHAVEQLKELGNQPLAMGETDGTTDESGHFSLELDPGIYQFDFIPGEDLPRTSRQVTVRADVSADSGGGLKTIDLNSFPLSRGRRVNGVITLAPSNAVSNLPAINAAVRYFRVTQVEGRPTSLLLGEALTDERGNYSVVLPAR